VESDLGKEKKKRKKEPLLDRSRPRSSAVSEKKGRADGRKKAKGKGKEVKGVYHYVCPSWLREKRGKEKEVASGSGEIRKRKRRKEEGRLRSVVSVLNSDTKKKRNICLVLQTQKRGEEEITIPPFLMPIKTGEESTKRKRKR